MDSGNVCSITAQYLAAGCDDGPMQVSAKTDYALNAVLVLAAKQPEYMNINAMLSERAMPRKFLAAILVSLRDAGLVNTRRGPKGGYALARSPNEITIGAVFRAINGPFSHHLERGSQRPALESTQHTAQIRSVIGQIMEGALEEVTVAQVMTEVGRAT